MTISELRIYKFGGWGLLFNTPTRGVAEFPLIMQSLLRRSLKGAGDRRGLVLLPLRR